eukprot:10302860-Ditylum_brightwellii.AAC.1
MEVIKVQCENVKIARDRNMYKNWNGARKAHTQNMDPHMLNEWPNITVKMLGVTELANDGAGLIKLKHAGGWKSSTANLLTGGAKKKQKREEKAEEVVSEEKAKNICVNTKKMMALPVVNAMKMPPLPVMERKPEWVVTREVTRGGREVQERNRMPPYGCLQ